MKCLLSLWTACTLFIACVPHAFADPDSSHFLTEESLQDLGFASNDEATLPENSLAPEAPQAPEPATGLQTSGNFAVEEITTDLILVGKGFRNDDGEVLALACTSALCSQARMVYFNPFRKKSYFFGAPIYFSEPGTTPTKAEIKTSLSALRKQVQTPRFRWRNSYGFLQPITAIGAGLGITLVTGGTVWVWIGTGLAIYKLEAMLLASKKSLFKWKTLSHLTSKEGWNWSENSKHVRYSTFEDLINVSMPQFGDGHTVFHEGGGPFPRYFQDSNANYQDIYEFRRESEAPLPAGSGLDWRSLHRR